MDVLTLSRLQFAVTSAFHFIFVPLTLGLSILVAWMETKYVKTGDEITIKDKPKSRQLVLRNLDLTQIVPVPDWLTVDRDGLSGKVARIPSREEMQPMVNEQLVVELYSR